MHFETWTMPSSKILNHYIQKSYDLSNTSNMFRSPSVFTFKLQVLVKHTVGPCASFSLVLGQAGGLLLSVGPSEITGTPAVVAPQFCATAKGCATRVLRVSPSYWCFYLLGCVVALGAC